MKIDSILDFLHPKNRKELFFIYTLLFFIIFLLTYLPFFLLNYSFLHNYDDGFLQHYEKLVQMKHALSQLFNGGGFSFWSWNIGLGSDTLGALGFVYFDPFNYIAMIFPEKYMDIGYTLTTCVQIYIAGIGFLYFSKIKNFGYKHSLWGALAYCFSSWILISSYHHNFFLTAAVIFVFLMVGIEKVLQGQSPFILIVFTALSAVTSFYFSFMTGLSVLIYLIFHYIKNETKSLKKFFHFWGRFIFYVSISACLSAFAFIPVIYTLVNAIKSSSSEYSLFFPLDRYLNYIVSFVGGNEIFYHYSTISLTPLFLILLPCVWKHIKKKTATPAMLTLFLSMIFLLFPVFNSLFNGFSYPVGRWCYTATFFFTWSGLQVLSHKEFDIKQFKKEIYKLLLFISFCLVLVGRIILNLYNEVTIITGFINIVAAFLFYWLLCEYKGKKLYQSAFITLLIAFTIIISGNIKMFPGISTELYQFALNGEISDKLDYSTQKAGTEIKDSSFYRIDQADHITSNKPNEGFTNNSNRNVHVTANETLVFNTRSIYTYLSTTPSSIFELNRELCNNASYFRRVCIYNNDNRTRLDFLTGVKYFLGNNPLNYPPDGADEYASYGFKLKKQSKNGVHILKNKYSIGLGCTFNSFITESEWKQLDYTEREQALMEHVILPDNTSTTLQHADCQTISSGARPLAYKIISSTGIYNQNGTELDKKHFFNQDSFVVDDVNGNIKLELDNPVEDCEIYLIFRNLKRKSNSLIPSKEDANNLIRLRASIQSINRKDYGNFIISVNNGSKTKIAHNTIGDPQGFSDIKDYTINLGRYNKKKNTVTISFNTIGTYTYDCIEVLKVPLSTYIKQAEFLQENSYDISTLTDDYINGTISSNSESSILYLSIPFNHGWKAYVDGKEIEPITVNIAYTGIPLSESGTHTVTLKYRPVGFRLSIILFIIGLLTFTTALLLYKKKKHFSLT